MDVIHKFIYEKGLIKQQIESFDDFINNKVDNIVKSIGNVKTSEFVIKIANPRFTKPVITESNGDVSMVRPKDARLRNLTYLSNIYCDFEVKKIKTDETKVYKELYIGSVPVMIGSMLCNGNYKDCPYDIGGYFIVSGSEKVIIAQEKMTNNEFFIFERKNGKVLIEGEIRCLPENTIKSTTTIRVSICSNSNEYKYYMKINLPFLKSEIPALAIFRYFNYDIEECMKDMIKKYPNLKYSVDEANEIEDIEEYFVKQSLYKENSDYVKYQMKNFFLHHTDDPIGLYKYIIEKLLYNYTNKISEDDRDHWKNKRVDMVGCLFATLFRQLYKKFTKDIQTSVSKQDVMINSIPSIIKPKIITNGLKYALATGNWGINASFRTGVSQVLNRHSYMSTLSHLRRINSPLGKEGKMVTPRQLHGSHCFRICPCETPEGHSCGLVKNMALTNIVTLETMSLPIKNYLKQFLEENANYYVFVNGDLLGKVSNKEEVVQNVKEKRRNLYFSPDISIYYDDSNIKIYTDAGRCVRPLIILENGKYPTIKPEDTWSDLLRQGKVEYIDCMEEENLLIAFSEKDIEERGLEFTHCELHPSAMLGVTASNIPFAEHNQAPRNVYQSAMGKQAMGMFATNHNDRMDTFSHILHYPQKPLVKTHVAETLHFDEMPSGMNVVVAIMCYTGYNQEDSIIMNKSAIDRGLFRSTFYRTYKAEQNHSSSVKENIEIPNKKECVALKYSDYSKLDQDGIVKNGVKIESDDIIVGKTLETVGVDKKKDSSLGIRHNEDGYIDKVMVSTNEQGMPIIKVKVRSNRIPEIGDKFASRAAQKGTIGMVYSQEDMPFTQSGIVPDIIMNPHAIPSRMTVGQLIECIYGKHCAMEGEFGDATIFDNPDPNKISDALESLGFNRHGEETMCNGLTGEMLKARIFIGPTYYQRLKHMVADKIHARSRGPLQILTRQPVEGRARDGGLRFGKPFRRKVCRQLHASLRCGRRHSQIAGNSRQLRI